MAEEFFGEAPQEEVFDPTGWQESPEYKEDEFGEASEDAYYEDDEDEGEFYESGYHEEDDEEDYEDDGSSETPVMDYVSGLGYDVEGYDDDSNFLDDIAGSYQAALNRQHELQNQMQELESRQQQDVQDVNEYYEDELHEDQNPEFDPRWAQLVEQDETGRYILRPEYIGTIDPSVAERVNEYADWRHERSNSLIDNPMEMLLDDGLEDYIEARISDAISSTSQETELNNQAEQFVAENAEILYLTNENGELLYDPGTQEPMLSPIGQALNDTHLMLLEQGMDDPVARHNIAMQLVSGQMQHDDAPPPPEPGYWEEEGYYDDELLQGDENDYYKQQYEERPFEGMAQTDYMPDGQSYPQAGIGLNGMPEHNSLGSLATQLAVYKGYLQPKG
tara:strand:- start:361 stop:1533 length:1173 start_codon:yes stop_codon:yes gene_type:complete